MALQALFGTDFVFVNVYSLPGMACVDGLHYSPMAFLLMTAAFRAMDPALEESALMSGASVRPVAWRITLRLSWPAAFATLLILFVRAIESFEVPALLGLPAGIQVFTSAIYAAVHRYPEQIGLASAYAVTLLADHGRRAVAPVAASRRAATLRDDDRQGLPAAAHRPRPLALSSPRRSSSSISLLIVVLPFLVLLWSSFQKFYAVPSLTALQHLTLDPYRFVFAFPSIARATLEQPGAGRRHGHGDHARHVGHLLDRREDAGCAAAGCSTTSRRCRWCSRASCSASRS